MAQSHLINVKTDFNLQNFLTTFFLFWNYMICKILFTNCIRWLIYCFKSVNTDTNKQVFLLFFFFLKLYCLIIYQPKQIHQIKPIFFCFLLKQIRKNKKNKKSFNICQKKKEVKLDYEIKFIFEILKFYSFSGLLQKL